jgi:hypothetical protein
MTIELAAQYVSSAIRPYLTENTAEIVTTAATVRLTTRK